MTDPGERTTGAESRVADPATREPQAGADATDTDTDTGDADPAGSDTGDPDRTGVDDAAEPAIRPVDGTDIDRRRSRAPEDSAASGPGPDGDRRTLDPRIRAVWLARALVGVLVATGIALLLAVVLLDGALWLPVGTFLAVGLGAAWLARARYRRWSYVLRADSLLLDRGVVTRVRTVVPYVRIQHVDTRRGPVERALGLASVVVYTAGTRGADVTVPGLTRERAEELQGRLKRIAIRAEGEDAV